LLGGTLAAGTLLIDWEGMVRRRVSGHLREIFSTQTWPQGYARHIEGVTRDVLVQNSVSLIARFEEALGQQRRLRAEKDMEKRRCESVLLHFQQSRLRLQHLRSDLDGFKVF